MAEAVLRDIARSSRSLESSQRQFKQTANENNRSITKIVKDIATTFAAQRKDSADISNAINESIVQSQQTASKVDATNGLLQESVTLQSMMVNELKNMRIGIRNLGEKINQFVNLLGGGSNPGGGGGPTPTSGNTPRVGGGRGSAARNLAMAGAGVGAVGTAAYLGIQALTGGNRETASTRDTSIKSVSELVRLAKEAGFSDTQAPIMASIAASESSGNPSAHNPNAQTGDNSFGLWQINMLGRMGPERRRMFGIQSDEELFDPKVNARAAKKIFDMQGFNAWSDYKNNKYMAYMGTAQRAISESGTSGQSSTSQATQQSQPNNTATNVTPPAGTQSTSGGSDSASGGSSSAQSSGTQTPPSQGQSTTSGGENAAALSGVGVGLAKKLQEIQSAFGGNLKVISGYRDEQRNQEAGGAGNSAHLRGNAVDVRFEGGVPETLKLIEDASKAGIGGIGVYGPGSVHLDVESKRAWGRDYRRGSVPQWAEGAIRAHETNKWGEYDASARGGEEMASRVGGGPMVGAGLGGMGMGGGMGYNPMAMMGMFGGGRVGAIAGAIGSLAPMIGGLIGGIGGMGAAQAAPLQPQQAAVERGNLFDFKQFSQLPEDQQTSARFFEAEMNERLRKSQSIQERAVATNVRREQADQRTAETPPPPPPRPDDSGGGQTVINNNNSSGGMFQGDNWMKEVYARFGGGTMPTVW
jgi:hypothetical protein